MYSFGYVPHRQIVVQLCSCIKYSIHKMNPRKKNSEERLTNALTLLSNGKRNLNDDEKKITMEKW